VIVNEKGIKDSCKEYMEKLMNDENEWDHTQWSIKKCVTLFWTVTPAFLDGFQHFVHQ